MSEREGRPEGLLPHRYGARTATLLVIASMIGTGVFTTSGLLLRDLGSPGAVLAVWAGGGLIALAGALSYAEIAARHQESGGEYALLSRSFHPAVGFCAGVVSMVAGFAAPIAATAMAFAEYLRAAWPEVPALPTALGAIAVISALHAIDVTLGARAQDLMTVLKALVMAGFVIGGALVIPPERFPQAFVFAPVSPGAVETGLVLVYYAYTGWNATAYFAGELERPERTLPLALLLGTFIVMLLYVSSNLVFLVAASPSELSGEVAIGEIAARRLFGGTAAGVFSLSIAAGLLSSLGAFVMTGARVYEAMGRDHPRRLGWLARGERGTPHAALLIQAGLASAMVITSSFEALLHAVGFVLSVSAAITVLGLFVDRRRAARSGPTVESAVRVAPGYRVPLYPLTPIFFVLAIAWTAVHELARAPEIAGWGALTIAAALLAYRWARS